MEPEREALSRLEGVLGRLLEEYGEMKERARTAEENAASLEGLLEKYREGDEQPGDILKRLQTVETENRELRDRLDEGRASVERLLAQIRFLEEQQ